MCLYIRDMRCMYNEKLYCTKLSSLRAAAHTFLSTNIQSSSRSKSQTLLSAILLYCLKGGHTDIYCSSTIFRVGLRVVVQRVSLPLALESWMIIMALSLPLDKGMLVKDDSHLPI